MSSKFDEKASTMSNEALLEVVAGQNDWQPEMVKAVFAEVERRGLSNQATEISESVNSQRKNHEQVKKERENARLKKLPYTLVVIALVCLGTFWAVAKYRVSDLRSTLEKELRKPISEKTGLMVKNITLLQESDNKFSGMVTFMEGAESKLSVLVQGDRYLWELEESYYQFDHPK